MSSRTRDKLIEVARALFMRQGVENTTIGDIANASEKGRRTIYTYFKNKREIYMAVVERESDHMVQALRDIADSNMLAKDKLRKFFELRFSQTKISTSEPSALKSMLRFDFDFRRNEMIRKKAYQKEEAILFSILDEGIDLGEFDAARCQLMRDFLYRLLQAIDTLSMHDEFSPAEPGRAGAFVDFLVKGVER